MSNYMGGNFYRRTLMYCADHERPIEAKDLRPGMLIRRELSVEMWERGCVVPPTVRVSFGFNHGSYVRTGNGERIWEPHPYEPSRIMNHGGRYRVRFEDGSWCAVTCIPSARVVLVHDPDAEGLVAAA
jgi:hypothetical protein